MADSGVKVTIDRLAELAASLHVLTAKQVLIGIPEPKGERQDSEITNAALAYIHTNGAPEANIPARPFLQPGIERKKDEIAERLKDTASAALLGPAATVERGLMGAGQIAASSAQAVITEGIPPPLKDSTLRERARRGRKGAGRELARRAAGAAPSLGEAKPLIDTGQLRRAITFVLRKR